jgi:uncharacterized protein (UPF0335 family)
MDKSEVIAGLQEAKQQWDCPVAVDWAIEKIEALEAENAALLKQMQEMVRMAAEKNRPAYDEQQRVIMELRDENAALKARGPVLSDAELDAIDEGFDAITYRALNFVGYPKGDELTAHATVLRKLLERTKR